MTKKKKSIKTEKITVQPFGDPQPPLPPCPKGYKRNAAGECVLDVG